VQNMVCLNYHCMRLSNLNFLSKKIDKNTLKTRIEVNFK
jgi:hypothetical protein